MTDLLLDPGLPPAEREAIEAEVFRGVYEAWKETQPKPKRLRLRVELDPAFGRSWLGLLAVCAWLRGGIIGNERGALDVAVEPRWPYPEKHKLANGRIVTGPDSWEQYKEWRREAGDAAWQ